MSGMNKDEKKIKPKKRRHNNYNKNKKKFAILQVTQRRLDVEENKINTSTHINTYACDSYRCSSRSTHSLKK